jgi:hypothetical protein
MGEARMVSGGTMGIVIARLRRLLMKTKMKTKTIMRMEMRMKIKTIVKMKLKSSGGPEIQFPTQDAQVSNMSF